LSFSLSGAFYKVVIVVVCYLLAGQVGFIAHLGARPQWQESGVLLFTINHAAGLTFA